MRNRRGLACLLVAAAALASAAVAQQVRTETGMISGVRANGSVVYKGIPFAVPPVGDLRWRPPATCRILDWHA
jgi:para-nitrobenzyl esterase